jgi:hypothetical protein
MRKDAQLDHGVAKFTVCDRCQSERVMCPARHDAVAELLQRKQLHTGSSIASFARFDLLR